MHDLYGLTDKEIKVVEEATARRRPPAIDPSPPSGYPRRMPGTTDPTDPVPEMVRIIVERFHPEKVVLFGSRARGEGGPSSDVDLLVVARVHGSRRRFAADIDEALAPLRVPKDVVVATPEEVERSRDVPGSICGSAEREGKVVYERG